MTPRRSSCHQILRRWKWIQSQIYFLVSISNCMNKNKKSHFIWPTNFSFSGCLTFDGCTGWCRVSFVLMDGLLSSHFHQAVDHQLYSALDCSQVNLDSLFCLLTNKSFHTSSSPSLDRPFWSSQSGGLQSGLLRRKYCSEWRIEVFYHLAICNCGARGLI